MANKRLYDLDNIIINSGETSLIVDHLSFDVAKKTTIDDVKNYMLTKSSIITSNYSVLKTDYILIISGITGTTINLTLPIIINSNTIGYVIKNVGYSNINILTNDLIDGYTSITITDHNTTINIKPIANSWYIMNVETESLKISNDNNEIINPAQNETIILLRRMVKMLESNTVVDANMRQKVIVDQATSCYGPYALGVGGTNYPTANAPSANSTVSYVATWAGPIDPRWTNIEQAFLSYNTGIRNNLI
jgi:hypothetical protein